MAKLNELTNLFKALADQDWSQARTSANKLADGEERIGHHSAAALLRGILSPNGQRGAGNHHSQPQIMNGFSVLAEVLTPVSTTTFLNEVFLKSAQRAELLGVVAEWRHRSRLEKHGLRRRNKLLFHGPPGCGKSLTARVLGRELELPVYVVRLDAIVGAYLGQTALRIRELFRFAESAACVLLMDEVDAIGKSRGNPLDVGELDRVVISLMQELEHSEPMGFLIAASNIPQLLDKALWRRFDLVVDFPRPSRSEISAFVSARATVRKLAVTGSLRKLLRKVRSYAEAEQALLAEERRIVLEIS